MDAKRAASADRAGDAGAPPAAPADRAEDAGAPPPGPADPAGDSPPVPYGPLELRRLRKDDGRALLLYSRPPERP